MFAEVRSATRGLAQWRGSAIAILTLAIGIAATTGLAALVRGLVADLSGVPAVDRLGRVYATSTALGVDRGPVALAEFDTVLSSATSFRAMGAYADQDALVGSGLDARPVVAGYASPGFFGAMGVPPTAGRVFTAADPTGPPVVVVSETLWRRQFSGARLGEATLIVDGVERTVVGVMPASFRYHFIDMAADLWLPLGHARFDLPAVVHVIGRLRDGVAWPAAQAELAALSRRGSPGEPGSRAPASRSQWTFQAIPLSTDVRARALRAYAMTLAPALLLLLVACVNVASLLMARGVAREEELTIRRALGASRGGVIRLLLLESLLLALVSGALGGALASGILRLLSSALAPAQPDLAAALTTDLHLLPIVIAASALACVCSGVIPAVRLSRRDIAASLSGRARPHRVRIADYGARDAVVFAQVAAAVGFAVWTAMFYTLFAQMNAVKLNFAADRIIGLRVPAESAAAVSERIGAIPGVTSTAVAAAMLGGGSRERAARGHGTPLVVARIPVGDGYFETLDVPLVHGRTFTSAEQRTSARVAVITESGARHLARDGNAVGMRLTTSMHGDITIVGVCRDPVDFGAVARIDGYAPELYVPYEPPTLSREAIVLVRTAADAHESVRAVADAAPAAAGTRPARPVVLSDDFDARQGARGSMVEARALAAFAGLTLLLAASGVFAVIAHSMAHRRREFGIRLAIGATPGRVLRMVLAREGKLIAAGIATGTLFTFAATRALFANLVRLNTLVPSLWLAGLAISAATAALALLCATWGVARRT